MLQSYETSGRWLTRFIAACQRDGGTRLAGEPLLFAGAEAEGAAARPARGSGPSALPTGIFAGASRFHLSPAPSDGS